MDSYMRNGLKEKEKNCLVPLDVLSSFGIVLQCMDT